MLVVVVSASGALSPGPLFFATIEASMKTGRYTGFAVAAGHMVFELPLVIAIGLGIWNFVNDPVIGRAIGFFGAAALIAFGVIQLRSALRNMRGKSRDSGKASQGRIKGISNPGLFAAFLTGLAFTALNPYFLMWWFTFGLPLILEALKYGALYGILLMFAFHIWLDYAWLGLTGYATAIGSKFLKEKYLNAISIALALIILLWGVWMLESAITAL